MKKKDFQSIIAKNKAIFNCIIAIDASVTNQSKHTSISICWHGMNNVKTTVKTIRGNVGSIKAIEELRKYKLWAVEVITQNFPPHHPSPTRPT
jgi:hypothetical protein